MLDEKKDDITLSIKGVEINYEYHLEETGDLRFYRKNPRIATILDEQSGEITDDFIDNVLWSRNETHKLYTSILKDGD
jgi:hypothetical protein